MRRRHDSRSHPALGKVIAATLLAFGSCRLSAQEASAENPLRQALRVCAALGNDSERLACYDKTAETLVSDVPANSRSPSPEEMFGAGRRSSQGLPAESAAKRKQLTEITARVALLRELEDGSVLIELDNGQVWKQSSSNTPLLIRVGDRVRISRGALGTFRLAAPNGRFTQVRRLP
jgi:hypothetical protein